MIKKRKLKGIHKQSVWSSEGDSYKPYDPVDEAPKYDWNGSSTGRSVNQRMSDLNSQTPVRKLKTGNTGVPLRKEAPLKKKRKPRVTKA